MEYRGFRPLFQIKKVRHFCIKPMLSICVVVSEMLPNKKLIVNEMHPNKKLIYNEMHPNKKLIYSEIQHYVKSTYQHSKANNIVKLIRYYKSFYIYYII